MKKIICVMIGVLLICNIFLCYKYRQLKNLSINVADKYSTISIHEERISEKLKTYILIQQAMENTVPPDVVVKNAKKDSCLLAELAPPQSAPILCFRFKESHCDACIQHTIRRLNEYAAIIPQKIIVLSGYANFNHFAAFESSQNKNLSIYNVEHIPHWEIEDIEQSYFFVLHEGRIHSPFIPLKEDNNYTDRYIHTLIHKFWEESSCSKEYQSNVLYT